LEGEAMRLLGVSCDYHDAAAALVVDGVIVAACEEERFSRVKHDRSLPVHAIRSCLEIGDVDASEIDAVVFHEKPLGVLGRVVHSRQRRGPRAVGALSRELPVLLKRNLMVHHRLSTAMLDLGARKPPPVVFGQHHVSHAAAAFYPSPFESAAVLTIDAIGEASTTTIAHGRRHRLETLGQLAFPDSLGLLYTLVTIWCGFAANDGEYKLMGLAPYGEPAYEDALVRIAALHEDGSLSVDPKLVGWWAGDPRANTRLAELLGGPPRRPEDPLTRREADLARSMQDYLETAVSRMADRARLLTGEDHLCLAGGVALNCAANGRLLRDGSFDDIWVQPAAGDAGSAVGAPLWYWHDHLGNPREPRRPDGMSGALLGPSFDSDAVSSQLDEAGVPHERIPDREARCRAVAERLAQQAVVGWFEGRMEFGPRALGHRSILADPRRPDLARDLNRRVKGREPFRPFAPAVLAEAAGEWFELSTSSPYMTFTFPVREDRRLPVDAEPDGIEERCAVARSQIPACTHVDWSARVQTVDPDVHPTFARLLGAFRDLTGCPVLLNTSFNRAGEPIVATPLEAVDTAVRCGLDVLVVEDSLVEVASVGEGKRR
jgi:carbamoyltransferase